MAQPEVRLSDGARLLAGAPQGSMGKLTVAILAIEAGVSPIGSTSITPRWSRSSRPPTAATIRREPFDSWLPFNASPRVGDLSAGSRIRRSSSNCASCYCRNPQKMLIRPMRYKWTQFGHLSSFLEGVTEHSVRGAAAGQQRASCVGDLRIDAAAVVLIQVAGQVTLLLQPANQARGRAPRHSKRHQRTSFPGVSHHTRRERGRVYRVCNYCTS